MNVVSRTRIQKDKNQDAKERQFGVKANKTLQLEKQKNIL